LIIEAVRWAVLALGEPAIAPVRRSSTVHDQKPVASTLTVAGCSSAGGSVGATGAAGAASRVGASVGTGLLTIAIARAAVLERWSLSSHWRAR
jgi:hypothetical protein